jgi:hypothetical protein
LALAYIESHIWKQEFIGGIAELQVLAHMSHCWQVVSAAHAAAGPLRPQLCPTHAEHWLIIIPPSVPPSPAPPSPAHWAWHIWSVPRPSWAQGVFAAQVNSQSYIEPMVAQLMPAMLQVKPVHIWMWAQAMSQGVVPVVPLDDVVDVVDEAVVVVVVVAVLLTVVVC